MNMGDDHTYTIEELAAEAGMTARNVRAYRTRGLLPPPMRRGRVTVYDRRHLRRLLEIQQLRAAGVPLRMITEAAGRGADLGPGGDLWRIMTPAGTTAESPSGAGPPGRVEPGDQELDPPDDPPDGLASIRNAVPPTVRPPSLPVSGTRPPVDPPPDVRLDLAESAPRSVDLRGAEAGTPRSVPPDLQQLDPQLVGHLDRDVSLRRQLITLGVISGGGRLLYGSAEVNQSLRGLMGEGVGPGTALGVALQTAELTQALATVVANAFGDAGHALTSANQELLERLAVGVLRDALAKEFDSVR
jgi:hypothetical protein